MKTEIGEWDFRPKVGDDCYGVYFPEDGYMSHQFVNQDEAKRYAGDVALTPMGKGAYVVRVQIEKVVF